MYIYTFKFYVRFYVLDARIVSRSHPGLSKTAGQASEIWSPPDEVAIWYAT